MATGTNFPDALAGGAAAGARDGPVVLVAPNGIPPATANELTRLAPQAIRILGGPAAVSPGVEAQLQAFSLDVKRVSGATRYATAIAVSDDAFPGTTPYVFLATGLDFPDALAVDVAAGASGSPLLLVPKSCIPAAVNAEIDRLNPGHLVIVGGPAVVTPAVDSRTPC